MTHPDVETIADHMEGLLTGSEAERVGAHVADCAECSATMAELTEVQEVLAARAAEPVPMPPDVLSRLEARLAQEVAHRESAGAAQGRTDSNLDGRTDADDETVAVEPDAGAGAEQVVSLDERRRLRRRRVAGGLVAAAMVTVVGVGVTQVVQNGGLGGAGQGDAGGAAPAAEAERGPSAVQLQDMRRDGARKGAAESDQAPKRSGGDAGAQIVPPNKQQRKNGYLRDMDNFYDARQGRGDLSRRAVVDAVASFHEEPLTDMQALRSDGESPADGETADRPRWDQRRERTACVTEVLGAGWSGASYAVRHDGKPAAVVLYPVRKPTDAWLIQCGAEPRKLLYKRL